ncbi:MAG: hypothetical protein NWR72_03575 [Bacteroidia bacterium]|nr:hypothetical protein [Bacteroidia bacterium]
MSNYTSLFFLSFCFFFQFPSVNAAVLDDNGDLQQQADQDFLYENYQAAVRKYAILYESGQKDESMLYRLAFLHEQLSEYPQAIFYLRKLQWAHGAPIIDAKIISLLEQKDRSLPEGDPASALLLFSIRYRWAWLGGILAGLMLSGLALLIKPWKSRATFSLVVAGICLASSAWLLIQWQGHSPRAVIVLPTSFYELPAYSAETIPLPLLPGSTVKLLQSQDIWQQIEANGASAWVPAFVVAPLDEWE